MTRLSPQRSAVALLIALALGTLSLAGCASNPAKRTNLMKKGEVTEISAAELRIRVRALAGPFSGIVENAADKAMAGTSDPKLRRLPLQWKIDGIPAFQTAIFQPDPLAALLDTWALIRQVQNAIETGPAASLPDDMMAPMSQAMTLMEEELVKIGTLLGPEGTVERLKSAADKWAVKNPLSSGFKTRSPTTSETAAITADSKVGIKKSVSALTEGLGDMSARVDVYIAYLPKQARWQAEYLIGDVIGGGGEAGDLSGVIGEFTELSDAVTKMAGTVDELPETITAQRLAVFREIQKERLLILEAISRELQTIFQFATNEGLAAVSGLVREERMAVMKGVTAERIAAFEALHDERVATLDHLEVMVQDIVDDSLTRVVDHVFLRLAQLLIVLVAILGIGAFLVARSLRRRRSVA